MVTKKERAKRLNSKLDTNIQWEKLLEEDLKELETMLNDGKMLEKISKLYIKEHGKEKLEAEIDEWTPGKYLMELL